MGDGLSHTDVFWAPPTMPAPATRSAAQQTPHHEKGPLGPVTIVPDYYGQTAPGTIRESDYKRMTDVYGRIEAGQSQVKFDDSGFFKDAKGNPISLKDQPVEYLKAMNRADDFREQYMGHLAELVKTPAGLQLLEQLDHSKHSTTIALSDNNHVDAADWKNAHVDKRGRAGKGSDTVVGIDPAATTWPARDETCNSDHVEPWTQDRSRFGFYHELVHAYFYNRGEGAIGGHNHSACAGMQWNIPNWEWQAVGLGPYARNDVSENTIRQQMGAPLRPSYGGTAYDDPDPIKHRR